MRNKHISRFSRLKKIVMKNGEHDKLTAECEICYEIECLFVDLCHSELVSDGSENLNKRADSLYCNQQPMESSFGS